MDGKALLEPMYWLSLNPGPLSTAWMIGFAIVFGIGILAAAALWGVLFFKAKKFDKPVKRLLKRLRFSSVTLGLLGFLWLGLAYEMIPLFSARFWFVLWCMGVVYLSIQNIRFIQIDRALTQNRDMVRLEKEKYLFKKKK